jgi:hypothetical protein
VLSDPSEEASRPDASVLILKSIFVGTPQIAVFRFEIVCKQAQMRRHNVKLRTRDWILRAALRPTAPGLRVDGVAFTEKAGSRVETANQLDRVCVHGRAVKTVHAGRAI